MTVEMHAVDSEAIKSYGYDSDRQELHIEFNSGHRHIYSGVLGDKWAAFQAAGSKGKFFHAHVRSHHESRPHSER